MPLSSCCASVCQNKNLIFICFYFLLTNVCIIYLTHAISFNSLFQTKSNTAYRYKQKHDKK